MASFGLYVCAVCQLEYSCPTEAECCEEIHDIGSVEDKTYLRGWQT